MGKKSFVLVTILSLFLLLITWLPCQADDILYGCAKKKNGQLRLVSDHNKCLKSEYPVTLYGSALQNPVPNFKGELCWNVVWQNNPNYIMKLRVTHMGGGYYILQSEMVNVVGQDLVALFGSAHLVGNQIKISVHGTHSDSQPIPTWDADHYGCQLFLDSTTLNGSGWCTGVHYNPPYGTGGIDYSIGTLTYTNCP